MKKIAFLLAMVLLACLLCSCGPTETTSKESDFTITEDGVMTKYKGRATEIIIPDGVVGIDAKVFRNTEIHSVVIPDSCLVVGAEAFSGCKKLTSVTLPDNGIRLGAQCFDECTALTEINIPESAEIRQNPFNYTETFHDLVPCPDAFWISSSLTPKSGIVLTKMYRTDEGLLRLCFRQFSGNKYEVSFTSDGKLQWDMSAGFDVTLKMPDGSMLTPVNIQTELISADQESCFIFDFATDEKPVEITCAGSKETVVLNGKSWRPYSAWETE